MQTTGRPALGALVALRRSGLAEQDARGHYVLDVLVRALPEIRDTVVQVVPEHSR